MKETVKMKLLKRLPKKYHERVVKFEQEDDLVDDCKYMIYYSNDYTDGECAGGSYPIKSISEAIDFIKNSIYKVEIKVIRK